MTPALARAAAQHAVEPGRHRVSRGGTAGDRRLRRRAATSSSSATRSTRRSSTTATGTSRPQRSPTDMRARTVVVNSLSKTYAMTGWRVGYCAAPAPIIQAMFLVLQQSSRGPATFVQDAAAVALDRAAGRASRSMRDEYARRRALVMPGARRHSARAGAAARGRLLRHGRRARDRPALGRDPPPPARRRTASSSSTAPPTARAAKARCASRSPAAATPWRAASSGCATGSAPMTALRWRRDAAHRRRRRGAGHRGLRSARPRSTGEVRFDTVSRALYSTDASVYQIEPARRRRCRARATISIRHRRASARELRCPLTMRGGGTSQAGQAIGAGLDRRHVEVPQPRARAERRRALGARRAGHRARRAERAAAPARPALRARHLDRQPRHHRRHDGQQLERRALGALRQDHRSRPRAGRRAVRRLGRALRPARRADELDAQVRRRQRSRRECYRVVRAARRASTRDEIERRFPKVLRRVGGYNLDEFVDRTTPVQPGEADGRLRGHARRRARGQAQPRAAARTPRRCWRFSSPTCSRRSAATPLILRHGPSAVEVMDKFILDHTRQSAALDALRQSFIEGDPGALLCVEFYADRAEDLPPRLAGARARPARARARLPLPPRASTWPRRRASGACARPALGLSMAMKDDAKSLSFVEDTAVAPERLRDYIERFLGIVTRHGTTAGVYAHASVGCLHVRPVVNLKTEDGVRHVRGDRQRRRRSRARVRRRALGRARRRPRAQPVHARRCSARRSTRRSATIKRTFDPHGIFNPGKIVDAPPLTANLRFGAGYVTPNARDLLRLLATTAAWAAPSRCAAASAPAARRSTARCARRTWRRARSSTRRAAAPTCCGWRWPGRLGEAGLGDDGVYDDARSLPRVPRVQGRVPGRRRHGALQERVPRRLLAAPRHAARTRACSATRAPLATWGSRLAPLSNWIAEQRARRGALNERLLGIDRRRAAAAVHAPHARASGAAPRAARPTRCSSTTRSPTTTTRRSAWPRSTCCAAAGVRAALAPQPLLRPAADLEGPARGRARDWPRATPTPSTPTPRPAGRSSSASRAACRPCARTRPRCCAARRGARPSVVASACVLFEEFARAASSTRLPLQAGPADDPAARPLPPEVDGPARAGEGAARRAFPARRVVDLDAGCCGMAGSFGYAREHYDVSRAIGERKLLPGRAQPDAGNGRRRRRHVVPPSDRTTSPATTAVHPAVLLRSR